VLNQNLKRIPKMETADVRPNGRLEELVFGLENAFAYVSQIGIIPTNGPGAESAATGGHRGAGPNVGKVHAYSTG